MSGVSSAELFARAQQVAPGGVHSPVRSFKGLDRAPVFFESAEGAYLKSVEGQRYIDFCMSFGPLILGHRDPEVEEQVLGILHKAWTFGACDKYSLELAEFICENVPFVEKLRFVSSGTEAVMSALRVARAATGRSKILKFEGCYHGHVDSLLVKAGSGLAGSSALSSQGIPAHVMEETLVCHLDDEAALEAIFNEHGKDIAAVIIEPLPANYGMLIQRVEFLRFVQALARRHGALLIFDEVISGFRTAMGGMAEKLDITPDLVTYGKILGGGFPVGCYAGRREFMDLVAPNGPVYQAGTLSANPVGMVAGLATLKKMKRLHVWKTLKSRTDELCSSLQGLLDQAQLDVKVAHFESLFWIQSGKNTIRSIAGLDPQQSSRFKPLFLGALDRGVYLAPNAYEVGFVSLAHTPDILQQTLDVLSEVVKAR